MGKLKNDIMLGFTSISYFQIRSILICYMCFVRFQYIRRI